MQLTIASSPDLHGMSKLRSVDYVSSGDLHSVDRVCVAIGLQVADFIQRGQPGDDLAKNGVLTVLPRNWLEADIELTPIRLTGRIDLVLESTHCDGTAKMFSPYFCLQRVTGTACSYSGAILALAERIAALDQVIRKHPVDCCFLVEAILNQLFEIRAGSRRVGVKKTDRESALLPVFAFPPLNVEYGHRICQTGNR